LIDFVQIQLKFLSFYISSGGFLAELLQKVSFLTRTETTNSRLAGLLYMHLLFTHYNLI